MSKDAGKKDQEHCQVKHKMAFRHLQLPQGPRPPDPAEAKGGMLWGQIRSSGALTSMLAQGSKLSSETANWETEIPS